MPATNPDALAVTPKAPPSNEYVNGPNPPVTLVTVEDPFAKPHVAFVVVTDAVLGPVIAKMLIVWV